MFPRSVARRYARAFTGVLKGKADLAPVAAELEAFVALLKEHADLRQALLNPALPAARREAVASEVLKKGGGSATVIALVAVVLRNGHGNGLEAIAQALARAVDDQAGVVRAQVRLARPPGGDEGESIRRALARAIGREVKVTVRVDPSLIGGFVAETTGLVFDASLTRGLERMRARLIEA